MLGVEADAAVFGCGDCIEKYPPPPEPPCIRDSIDCKGGPCGVGLAELTSEEGVWSERAS